MPNLDLDKMNLAELKSLITQAQALIGKKEREERQALVQEMRELAAKRGFRLEDVLQSSEAPAPSKRSRSRGAAKPKYRHPENPDITWSGRGRKPKWIEEAESKGGLDALRVDE